MGKTLRLLLITFVTLTACQAQSNMIDKTVVKELDLQRYLGTWYELARFDHSFERGLTGVTATYSLQKDGKIKVLNAGYQNDLDGPRSEAIGKAKIPNLAEPSKLKVSFFWIFYADYFVLELNEDYQWAIIGSRSDQYLWILSRTAQVSDALYQELVKKATQRGYDTSKLIKVKHK